MDKAPNNKKEIPPVSDEERLQAWLNQHPENQTDILRECGPEIAELESMIDAFKEKHDLDALNAITHFSSLQEAREHPVWGPARRDFAGLFEKLKTLSLETNITGEVYGPLEQKVDEISCAIGIITRDWSVDHSKRMERGYYFPNR